MIFLLVSCWATYLIFLWIFDKIRFKHVNSNKTVLITGAAQGLGKEIALIYAARGCKVVIWDICDHLFPALKQEANEKGFSIWTFKCDITSHEQIKSALQLTLTQVPKIDILINNAGFSSNYLFEDIPIDRIHKTMNINAIGHLMVTKELSQYCEHFVAIASIMSKFPAEKALDYVGSKHAIDSSFRCLRMELKRKKSAQKVTIVYPIHIKTAMFDGYHAKNAQFLKSLEPKDAALSIYNAVCLGKEEVFLPYYSWIIAYILEWLPSVIRDKIYLFVTEGALEGVKSR